MTPSDCHLFGPGKKRILSLDGGGIRGAVTLGFLERLEAAIDELEGRPVRLADWFDLIGGTSTGSIVAALLALGYRVADIRDLYWRLGPLVFKRRFGWIFGWNAKFDGAVLAREIDRILGGRTMDSPDLLTGLCIVAKRLDTGSAWLVMNNPRSAFWSNPPDGSFRGNRHLSIGTLIRASTAAPSFFAPEPITLVEGQPPAVFVDGALTPHNNPALMMTMAALLPAFGLQWRTGGDNLLVVSIGTGSFRPTMTAAEARSASSIKLAMRSLGAIIAENQQLVLTLMTCFGDTVWPWPINSEIGDLSGVTPLGGTLFRFARYDVRLETDWLRETIGETIGPGEVKRLRRMDEAGNLDTLLRLGRKAAAIQIDPAHFAGFARFRELA